MFAPSFDSALFRVAATGGTPTPSPSWMHPETRARTWGLCSWRTAVDSCTARLVGDLGTYIGSIDSPERKSLSPDMQSAFGFASPDLLFFMRDRTLTAQRLDLNRLELVGEPIRVAENVDRLGPGAAFAVSIGGSVVHWSGPWTSCSPPGFDATARSPAPWAHRRRT